jgi:hypothetical protein
MLSRVSAAGAACSRLNAYIRTATIHRYIFYFSYTEGKYNILILNCSNLPVPQLSMTHSCNAIAVSVAAKPSTLLKEAFYLLAN